ncbi:hypothetical protein HDU98_002695 [Podochytrium sp. JEL0797]|nr:hypothetical protein HDU98_002695 [Podochytrium sp. JEL0797]
MLALLPTLALLATSILAAPAATSPQSAPVSCLNTNQASIVFRTLDANTLKVLKTQNFLATFFVPLNWVSDTSNQKLVWDALAQGHGLGLAIPTTTGLVGEACKEGPCDRTVRMDRLTKFMKAEAVGFAKAVPNKALKLVAFTNVSRISLTGGFMYPAEYTTLLSNTFQLGVTPVVAGFGQDTPNESSAVETDIFLSNFFGDAWLSSTPALDATAKFLAKREVSGVNLEDVNVVVKAAKFLQSNNKVEIVSMAKCLGHTVN